MSLWWNLSLLTVLAAFCSGESLTDRSPDEDADHTINETEMPATSDAVLEDGQKIQIVCGP